MPKKAHLPNVKRAPRPEGGVYLYHRHTGARLPDDSASPEFAAAWAKEEAKHRTGLAAPAAGPARESWAALVEAFKASDAWASLKPRTRSDYERCLAWLSKQGADRAIARELDQARCEILLDRAVRDRGWRQGVYVLQVGRRIYRWVLARAERRRTWGDANPWSSIELPEKPARPAERPKQNRAWKAWEVIEVLFAAPVGLRRAYVLGASGFDSQTAVSMRWAEYVEGGFDANRGKTDTPSWVMVPELLRMFLEEGDRPSDVIATAVPGHAFTPGGLQKRSSEFLAALAKKGTVGPGLTFHGLRHTIGRAVAESGGTLHAIMGALQHRSPAMALAYSQEADRRRALAATSSGLSDWFNTPASPDRTIN